VFNIDSNNKIALLRTYIHTYIHTYKLKIRWFHQWSENAIKVNFPHGYLLYQQSHTFYVYWTVHRCDS